MGRVRVTVEGEVRDLPLASTTLIGRHPLCLWPLAPPLFLRSAGHVPSFWLELRWFAKLSGWAFRPLVAGTETSGGEASEALGPGWLRLRANGVVGAPGGSASVRLADAGAPEALVVDVLDHTVISGEDVCNHVEETGEGWCAIGGQRLVDGAHFAAGGRVWRFFAPAVIARTAMGVANVRDHAFRIVVRQGARLVVQVGAPDRPIEIPGRFAALLAVYALAAKANEGLVPTGWVAHQMQELFGVAIDDATVGAYRARLVQFLNKQLVVGAPELFEIERGAGARARLAIARERIEV